MAGDKGAEVPKALKDYSKDEGRLKHIPDNFYSTRDVKISPLVKDSIKEKFDFETPDVSVFEQKRGPSRALTEAIAKAKASVARRLGRKADVPKDVVKEYLKKPDIPGLKAVQEGYYSKRNVRLSPAINEATNRATTKGRDLRNIWRNMTEEERTRVRDEVGQVKPDESYMEADARWDEAVNKVIAERNPTETQTTQSEE